MLAASTLVLIVVEVLVYGSLGHIAANRLGWPTWTAILAVPLGMALLRLLIVLRAFIVSARFSTEPRELRRLGFVGRFRLIAGEWLGTVMLYTVLQPLERFIMRRDPLVAPGGTPVLLVHGLVCNGGAWWWMEHALARRGITRCYTINLEPVLGDIDDYASQIARRVEDICTKTGTAKVLIAAHSMGGLASRAYLHRLDGARRVAGLVTLGSPHHGTALATLPVGENIRQMQLNHSWLTGLNECESLAAPVPITSIYTVHDNLVSPQESCRLAYAENIPLAGIGHVVLLFSERVADLVSEFVTRHSITGNDPTRDSYSSASTSSA